MRVRVCKELFDIDLPHIIRPLWTPEKCIKLLQNSGFRDVEIEKHLFRTEKISDNYASAQIENEFYPRGNPLLNLSQAQKELLQAEFTKAVDRKRDLLLRLSATRASSPNCRKGSTARGN